MERVQESQDDARNIDNSKSNVGGDPEEFLGVSGQTEVEDEDRGLGGHQRRVVENGEGVLGPVQRPQPGIGDIYILHPQSLGGPIVDAERERKGQELCQFQLAKRSSTPVFLDRSGPELTQASIMHQSSAVLRLKIQNRLVKRAATKMVAGTKVVVVPMKTDLPRE